MKDIRILTEKHLRSLLYSGVLLHDKSDDSYNLKTEYSDDKFLRTCWFTDNMKYLLGRKISAEELDDTTWRVDGWYITAWMLEDNYRRLMEMSYDRRFQLDANGKRHIKIMTEKHLDYLASAGHIKERGEGDYADDKGWFGGNSMPEEMYLQLCGKVAECTDDWIPSHHFLTPDRGAGGNWGISDWMIDDNFDRIFNDDKYREEEEEEDDDDEEDDEDTAPRNFVNIIGEIVEKSEDILTVSVQEVCVLVHITDCDYGVGQHVSVEGHLVRTSNMMGYPEVKCDYIKEA